MIARLIDLMTLFPLLIALDVLGVLRWPLIGLGIGAFWQFHGIDWEWVKYIDYLIWLELFG